VPRHKGHAADRSLKQPITITGRHKGCGQFHDSAKNSEGLRNPVNKPRAWAQPLVGANAGLNARDVEGFAVDLGDKVGVLRPMVQTPMCMSCDGPAEKIDPAVRRLNVRQHRPRPSTCAYKFHQLEGLALARA
jgi:hypothetical protein